MISFTIPLRTTGGLNAREHHMARHRRQRAEKQAARIAARAVLVGWEVGPPFPCVVTLTRVGPRRMDSDNAIAGLKAVRDGIAAALGVDDGDESKVRWEYAQERGLFAVKVSIEPQNRAGTGWR